MKNTETTGLDVVAEIVRGVLAKAKRRDLESLAMLFFIDGVAIESGMPNSVIRSSITTTESRAADKLLTVLIEKLDAAEKSVSTQ